MTQTGHYGAQTPRADHGDVVLLLPAVVFRQSVLHMFLYTDSCLITPDAMRNNLSLSLRVCGSFVLLAVTQSEVDLLSAVSW